MGLPAVQGLSHKEKKDKLLKACKKGDAATIKALIDSNADVIATDNVRRVMCERER